MANYIISLQQGDWQTDLVSNSKRQGNNAQGLPLSNGVLELGASIYSPQQAFRLTFQADGNVVLQCIDDSSLPAADPESKPASAFKWDPIWSIETTFGRTGFTLNMQTDGNLVLLNEQAGVAWASGTQGNGGAFLRMQDDGNLVIYSSTGKALWATNTYAGPADRPKAGGV
jgi:hypothetical protein